MLEIRPLRRSDHPQAIRFAAAGMDFGRYSDNKLLLFLYGRYFWNLELTRATRVLAAYDGDHLAGVLLAAVEGEPLACPSPLGRLYVQALDFLQGFLVRGGADVYTNANREMLARYQQDHRPDGELLFLAVDPERMGQGIGSFLLSQLEQQLPGKTLFLFTDSACTYQFYDRRGFTRTGEKEIVLEITGKVTPLTCMLYSKKLSGTASHENSLQDVPTENNRSS